MQHFHAFRTASAGLFCYTFKENCIFTQENKTLAEHAILLAGSHSDITVEVLKELSSMVMKNTGKEYRTALGDFSSSKGELRLLNVTAGIGGKSYMNYSKVPARLSEFCTWLNNERKDFTKKSIEELYELSFDAHYKLATIHPWADGNGRMARLVMNMLQFEFGLIPAIILKEDKEDYIKALVETRENDDLDIFRNFMTNTMIRNLAHDIEAYSKSLETTPKSREKTPKSREKITKSREKIISLIAGDGTLSASAIADIIGITPKAVEKHIARLKAEGIIKRIGPDKGGHWVLWFLGKPLSSGPMTYISFHSDASPAMTPSDKGRYLTTHSSPTHVGITESS